MLFFDTATVSGSRRTRDGYLVADVRAGRIGIQTYAGHEVGKPDMAEVRVYRSAEQVFAVDAMASAAFKPITNGHPPTMVDASNWSKYAVGQLSGDVARDGDFLRVPLVMMDAKAIADVESGKRELSLGYWSTLKFEPGVTPTGENFDAIQSEIAINHLAVVDHARGGSRLRIGDMRGPDTDQIALLERKPDMADPALKTVMVDGISISTTDQGAQVIAKLQQQLKDAEEETEAEKKKRLEEEAKAKKDSEAKDAQIMVLTTKLKDAELTPAKIDAAVKVRGAVIDAAKKIVGDKIVADGKSDADIRRQAVALKLGDAAVKDRSDDYVAVAFDTLVITGGGSSTFTDPVRDALGSGVVSTDASAARDKAYQDMIAAQRDAWKTPASKAA